MKLFLRVLYGMKLFWYGVVHYDLFAMTTFTGMAGILEMALKTAADNKPYITHLFMGKTRVVSFWTYPGIEKNPTDRITELVNELEATREMVYKKGTV